MYRPVQHAINCTFMALVLVLPFVLAPYLPQEVSSDISPLVGGASLLAIFMLVDWYYMYHTNNFGRCFQAIAVGVPLIIATLLIASLVGASSIFEFVERSQPIWKWFVFRLFIVGLAFTSVGLVSIPRLLAMHVFASGTALPIKPGLFDA